MKRVALFILTNLAVMVVLGAAVHWLGVASFLDAHGVGIDIGALLVGSLVFGMGGKIGRAHV